MPLAASMIPFADPLQGNHHSARAGFGTHHATAGNTTYTKEYLETQIAVMMGGRCAEEIFLNHMMTGAATTSNRPLISPARWSVNGG